MSHYRVSAAWEAYEDRIDTAQVAVWQGRGTLEELRAAGEAPWPRAPVPAQLFSLGPQGRGKQRSTKGFTQKSLDKMLHRQARRDLQAPHREAKIAAADAAFQQRQLLQNKFGAIHPSQYTPEYEAEIRRMLGTVNPPKGQ